MDPVYLTTVVIAIKVLIHCSVIAHSCYRLTIPYKPWLKFYSSCIVSTQLNVNSYSHSTVHPIVTNT